MRAKQVSTVIYTISGMPVLKTSGDGKITPKDFFLLSVSITVCNMN
jgi:hypothetical protein